MPFYRYTATDERGQLTRGRLDADSAGAVAVLLERQGLLALETTQDTSYKNWWNPQARPARWPIEEKILFTKQLASLLKAGIPLLTVLGFVESQTRNPRVAAAIHRIAGQVASGSTMSEAFASEPQLFDSIYLGAVRAGESSGQVDAVLEQTAAYLEREMNTRRQVSQTLRYPIIVIIAMIIAAGIILKFVVPQFFTFYSNMGADLPLPTRILMEAATWVDRLWWIILLGTGVIASLVWRALQTARGRRVKDSLLLKLPVFGPLLVKVAVGRFCRLFGVLYSAGVPATYALDTLGAGLGNVIICNEVQSMGKRVTNGESISKRPSQSVMPDLVYEMMGIGFESGEVDRMLAETARHFEQEVDYDVRRLNDKLQPFLLAILASGVLLLALAVLLPMWNLISVFRQ